MPKITREGKIKKIKEYLKESYKLTDEKSALLDLLLDELAWQMNELATLRDDINIEGRMVDFENGSQIMLIVNPKVKMYDSLIKSYNLTVRTINEIVKASGAKVENKSIDDTMKGFTEFTNAIKEARKSGVK